jgi:hypothetical protein
VIPNSIENNKKNLTNKEALIKESSSDNNKDRIEDQKIFKNLDDKTKSNSSKSSFDDKSSVEYFKNMPKFLKSEISIMYNKQKYAKILESINGFKSGNPLKEEEKIEKTNSIKSNINENLNNYSYLKLSSIIFFSSESWIIWLNDQKINKADNEINNEIYIKDISKEKVSVIWKMNLTKWKFLSKKYDPRNIPDTNENKEVVLEFSLRPQQIYLISENKVVNNFNKN